MSTQRRFQDHGQKESADDGVSDSERAYMIHLVSARPIWRITNPSDIYVICTHTESRPADTGKEPLGEEARFMTGSDTRLLN